MSDFNNAERKVSLCSVQAFHEIGVTPEMTQFRRHRHLLEETLMTTQNQLLGIQRSVFIFGSQSEGTTTLGMKSDTDFLHSVNANLVVMDRKEWREGMINMLAYHDENTPPQYFNLMRLKLESSGIMTEPLDDTDEVDTEGRVRVTHMLFDDRIDASMSHHVTQTTAHSHGPQVSHGGIIVHGPARSWTEEFDFIHALPCERLPEECEFLFTRPRPGHYPKPETLQYARRCRAFLIPQGSPDSNPRYLQWRFSTSLIERQLVFDFTEVQHLTFMLLKMMRKSYIKPRFKDNLSIFHLKTVTMFVIESYSPGIWYKGNIVNCVSYCLNTLLRWIKLRMCPHFTTGVVNLFAGKFKRSELEQLKTVIQDIRSQLMWCITNLEINMLVPEYRTCWVTD